ncbi:MAG: hypothetical protein AVO38_08975 [delta proteobacterium ML8_D]|jgi:uncharacterized protein|nr:MAG: hypothetical protein AVO38_08975 [delta proteobacterium ML8_D]
MGEIAPANKKINSLSSRKNEKGISPGRTARYQWLRLLRLRGDPFVLARGVAIGIFVGLTPTIPFHTILVVFFCAAGRGNLVAGIIVSFLVSNPLTIPLHYYLAWKVGTVLTGTSLSWETVKNFMDLDYDLNMFEAVKLIYINSFRAMVSILLGGIVFSLPFAIAGYFSALFLYSKRQKRQMNRSKEARHNDLSKLNKQNSDSRFL